MSLNILASNCDFDRDRAIIKHRVEVLREVPGCRVGEKSSQQLYLLFRPFQHWQALFCKTKLNARWAFKRGTREAESTIAKAALAAKIKFKIVFRRTISHEGLKQVPCTAESPTRLK